MDVNCVFVGCQGVRSLWAKKYRGQADAFDTVVVCIVGHNTGAGATFLCTHSLLSWGVPLCLLQEDEYVSGGRCQLGESASFVGNFFVIRTHLQGR